MNTEKPKSTFERYMQDPEFKKNFEEGYQELLLSEMLLNPDEVSFNDFINAARSCGYKVVLEKDGSRILVTA